MPVGASAAIIEAMKDVVPELTAATLLDAGDHARSLERARFQPLADLARAEALQAGIASARLARGERPVGYKIGFTNRAIWPLYGVFQPIWAPVWDTTLTRAAAAGDGAPAAGARVVAARVVAARFAEPRLEPEIVVGLRDTPADDTPEAVLAATAWIAHAFEIVQSPFPGWRFSAAEAVAAQALHGALIIGPTRPVGILGDAPDQALARLAALELELLCDGRRWRAAAAPMRSTARCTQWPTWRASCAGAASRSRRDR